MVVVLEKPNLDADPGSNPGGGADEAHGGSGMHCGTTGVRVGAGRWCSPLDAKVHWFRNAGTWGGGGVGTGGTGASEGERSGEKGLREGETPGWG